MRLRTLGGLTLQGEVGARGARFTRRKSLLLLAYLAIENGRDRTHLAALFFNQTHDPLGSLRTTVRRLRQALPGVLDADGDTLRVRLECDAVNLLARMDAALDDAALELYTGPFLAGLSLRGQGEELEEWVYATREHLAARVRSALLSKAESSAARGGFSQAGADAERAVLLTEAPEPEPEEYLRINLLLAAAQSPLLGRLRQQASNFDLNLSVGTAEARDALIKVETSGTIKAAELPTRATSFVGRHEERQDLLAALAQPEVRLVTLVGPGGIGKTRLALEVARALQDEWAAAFIPLEAVTSLDILPTTIANAVGTVLPAGQLPFRALIAALSSRQLLLVLDGAEHLLPGTPWLSQLLSACPNLKVLVTSRERLEVEAEWVSTLGGLKVPVDPAGLTGAEPSEAVELFVQRARRARLDFTISPASAADVVEVCRQVQGSPLGIELAAAWIKMMSPADIAEEMAHSLDFLTAGGRDTSEKHSSVRAVFDQTWDRLSEAERTLLARCSVFRGGFTREAAGRVAGATLPSLAALISKSLIRLAEHGRYEFHALLLQFIGERLAQRPEEHRRLTGAHAEYVLDLCLRAGEQLREGSEDKRWLERVERDIDNIRTALNFWFQTGQADTALRAMLVTCKYWLNRGRMMREARAWFARALAHGAVIDDLTRERTLALDGRMAMFMGEFQEAGQQLEASLLLTRKRGGTSPQVLMHLGIIRAEVGQMSESRRLFEDAISQYRLRNDDHEQIDFLNQGNYLGIALNNLGNLLMQTGELDEAILYLEEALYEERRSNGGEVEIILCSLGEVHVRLQNWDIAEQYLIQAVQEMTVRGSKHGLTTALRNLILVAISRRQYREAAVLLGIVESHSKVYETVISDAERNNYEQQLSTIKSELNSNMISELIQCGRIMNLEDGIKYAIEKIKVKAKTTIEV